jgi:hypothetical protein
VEESVAQISLKMTPEKFAKGFYVERKELLDLYFKSGSRSDVFRLIQSLNLDPSKHKILQEILAAVLRDAFYSILLGLDGEAQIGGVQEMYRLFDENGNELIGGEIEVYAWEYFHNGKFEADIHSNTSEI